MFKEMDFLGNSKEILKDFYDTNFYIIIYKYYTM